MSLWDSERRFGLCIANEGHDRAIGSKADHNVDVIGQHRLREYVNRVSRGGRQDASPHNVDITAANTPLAPPSVPCDVRE
jgi:hypothetical protein